MSPTGEALGENQTVASGLGIFALQRPEQQKRWGPGALPAPALWCSHPAQAVQSSTTNPPQESPAQESHPPSHA